MRSLRELKFRKVWWSLRDPISGTL